MSESSSQVNPLDALAEEFVARHRAGERPSLEEYIARRPDLADDIRDLFPGLVVMEGVRPEQGDTTGPFASGPAPSLKQLGDFRILREVGRGGMGVVYEAEQESLGRHVALKVLPAHALLDPQRLRRFQREAKAAARLHHTNIVPVHGVGEQDGLHYYVMQFIQGQGLDQVLAELRKLRPAPAVDEPARPVRDTASAVSAAQSLLSGRFETAPTQADSTPPPGGSSSVRLPGQAEGTPPSRSGREYWRSVARIGVQVAEALAYAHGQGVLHRDVKPSNLLLDARGNVWVTDFGLAKAADSEDLTNTGDIVGTIRYMAPESFRGKGDARSDVYSLGLTLYELLALRPAFVGKDGHQLLAEVVHGEPPRPRSVNREIPHDLETVVLKAIARDVSHRYQTAAELADDLRRFVDDRPVRARRVRWAEHAWRWARRNPALAWMSATVLLLLLVGTAASLVAAYWFSRVAAAANRARADADKLAAAEARARGDADQANIEIQKNADRLLDDFKRLNRANALMETGQLDANAGLFDKALADYTAAVEQRRDLSTVWLTRGQFYLQFYCWDEAAADFAQGFKLQAPADPNLWLWHAQLRAYVGDQEGYRLACAGMIEKFGQTTDPATITNLAVACTAAPDALDDYSRLIQLLEKPATDGSNPTFLAPLLSVYCRAGRVDQALHQHEVDLQKSTVDLSNAELAMAYHAAKQDDKARKALDDLKGEMDQQLINLGVVDLARSPQSLMNRFDLGFYLLCRETQRRTQDLGAAEHPLFWVARGRGRADLGQWDAASSAVARAVALRPDDPQLLLEHSRMLAAQKRWDEALADYDKVLGQKPAPDDGNLWMERGRLYANKNLWDKAAQDFSTALDKPNYSSCSDWSANNLSWPQEMLKPDAAFEALTRVRPHDARAWQQRAAMLDLDGKEADAAAAYAKGVQIQPDNFYLLYDRAVFLVGHEHWDEAAADFAKVLERLPASPELGSLASQIYSQLQSWDKALDRTLALRPKDGQLYAVRARWHSGQSEWDKALADYDEALKVLPDETDIRRERGTLFAQLNRWKEAAADFDQVMASRSFGDDWFRDACLHLLTGDADGWRKMSAQIAERYPRTTDTNDAYTAGHVVTLAAGASVDTALAIHWEERAVAGQADYLYQQSLVDERGAYSMAPQAYSLHALGLAHYRAGHWQAAERYLGDALRTPQSQPNMLDHLGLVLTYKAMNQPDKARQEFDEAVKWLHEANADRPKAEAEYAPPSVSISDWLEFQVLRREAETALKEPPPKSEK